MAVTKIVVGSDARDLAITLVKASDGVTSVGTVASAKLQGKSNQLHGVLIDEVMSPAVNVVSLVGFGNLVTAAILAGRASALYTFRVRYLLGTKVDYSPEFQFEWVAGPLG